VTPFERRYAILVSGATLAAVLSPLLRDPPRDGFPLSHYPMFSAAPDHSIVAIPHVVGWSRTGAHRPIEPGLVDTEEVMQALQTITVAAARGPAAAADLCAHVAGRVQADEDYADIDVVEVRTDRYDVLRYFVDGREPLSTVVHARCAVTGREPVP
jgi:hypothetical protein